MGKKVNPRAFRQATMYKTPSRWFAVGEQYARSLQTDITIRKFLRKKFRDAGISSIDIERATGQITIIIHTSKPGVVIGRGGSLIEETKKEIKQQFFGSEKMKVVINIQEVREPDLDPEIIYQSIRDQIENRVPFRRAIKRAQEQVMRAGAKGCKITISGRLNGADIARTESVSEGRLPLQTLRANVKYTRGVADTVYGVIGIKVWIYTGDVFGDEEEAEKKPKKRRRPQGGKRKKRFSDNGKKGPMLRKKADIEKKEDKKATAKKTDAQPVTEEKK